MNIITKLRLSIFYPELNDISIPDKILHKIISNKNFKSQYKKIIKPFIKSLKEYKHLDYSDGTRKELSLDNENIINHLISVSELSKQKNASKYISFINDRSYQQIKINNYEVFNDKNFDQLFDLIHSDVFKENICEIVKNGHSERLIQFIKLYPNIQTYQLNTSIFKDNVWQTIIQNPTIGDTTALKLFNGKFDILATIINKGLFEGLRYTYENIPKSHDFIHTLGIVKVEFLSLEQFSMNFINNVGIETLNILYSGRKFLDESEFKKIFKIASYGNYELIQDLMNYNCHFRFKNISDDDMQKSLIESNINNYSKNEIFLNKYLGLEQEEIYYIKVFLKSINKVSVIPEEFKKKYSDIFQLLNQIFISTDEEIIKMSKTFSKEKKEEYKKLIKEFEEAANNVLRSQFVNDLEERNKKAITTIKPRKISSSEGKSIDVYDFTGQPFNMLVHAIVNNRLSVHNSYVTEIIKNPANWENIPVGNNHISASLISNQCMLTYGIPDNEDTLMFGFYNLPSEVVKFTDTKDAAIDRQSSSDASYNMRRMLRPDVNTITTVDDLMERTIERNSQKPASHRLWNEVGLSRINPRTGAKIKPDYIVCMDYISETSKKTAEYFRIPIYLIHRKNYSQALSFNEEKYFTETESIVGPQKK